MSAPASSEAEADRAASSGDLTTARRLLEQAAAARPDAQVLLKLAGVQRALGDAGAALTSVEQALAFQPLDFVSLVMRATLLDRLGSPAAGEAWTNALAQRPPTLPPAMTQTIAAGERKARQWQEAREKALAEAMREVEASATPDEGWRMRRFRDNSLRKTRPFHSEPTHYSFPGLVEREFHPRESFPWLPTVEAAAEVITAEFRALLEAERTTLMPYVQYAAHEPLDQWRELNNNPDWTAIHLWKNGEVLHENADRCPQTMALLATLPQPQVSGASPNAMFSLLAPGTHIPAHVGVSNTRLVCHLPLIVPEGCWFRVGAETRCWTPGEAFVFDDTIEHEAMNPSDRLRVVLIFDIWHPGLSRLEQDAVAAMTAADNRGGGEL